MSAMVVFGGGGVAGVRGGTNDLHSSVCIDSSRFTAAYSFPHIDFALERDSAHYDLK